tara:strand:+ start:549 stop:992 length:444 start_codon:yes stop_codon:yes gene_type:complete
MADKKVTQLTTLATPNDEDLLLLVDDPNGTPVSKKIDVKTFFGSIPSNTSITGTMTVSGNGTFSGSNTVFSSNVVVTGTMRPSSFIVNANKLTINTSITPSTNNATTELGAPTSDRPHDGTFFWDADYIYVAVSNTVIKRAALSTFT